MKFAALLKKPLGLAAVLVTVAAVAVGAAFAVPALFSGNPPGTTPTPSAIPTQEGTLVVPQPTGMKIVLPEKIVGALHNPGMGWVALEEPTYAGIADLGWAGDLPEIDNISLSTSWAHIELSEGVYDWSSVDRVISYWESRGKRINLRICTDTLMLPNTYKGVPDYLFDTYRIPYETYYYGSGPVTNYRVIDIRNAEYQRALRRFLALLAARYKDDPTIDVVEIRGFGVWGEWHSGHSFASYDERMAELSGIIDEYRGAFEGTGKLLALCAAWEYREDTDPYVSNARNYDDYVSWSAFDHAWTSPGVTFRRDAGAGALRYDSDARLLSDAFRSGKRLPLLAEYFGNPTQQISGSLGFSLIEGIDDILFKMRPNYSTVLGWVNAEASWLIRDYPELFERGNEKFGYRLAVDLARYPEKGAPGTSIVLTTRFSNSAVGRYWYKTPLVAVLLDKDGNEATRVVNDEFDARTLVNGAVTDVRTTLSLPADLAPGEYTLAVSMPGPDGVTPIKLGQAGVDSAGRYPLGTFTVDPKAEPADDPGAAPLTSDQLAAYAFLPDHAYSVTIRYQPGFALADFTFGTDTAYRFELVSASTAEGSLARTCGTDTWQDVSGEPGLRTFVFRTGSASDYRAVVSGEGHGPISVLSAWVQEEVAVGTGFDAYDFEAIDALFMASANKSVTLASGETAVLGTDSAVVSSRRKGHQPAFRTDPRILVLRPNTVYTVSFLSKTFQNPGNGAYMYLALLAEDGTSTDVGEWYERADRTPYRVTYTFLTGADPGASLVFGMHNLGAYLVDDLVLVEHPQGSIVTGPDPVQVPNQPRTVDAPLPYTEGFEAVSFAGTVFDAGANHWGRMTTDPALVLTGKASLLGTVEPTESEWYEFAHSRPAVVPFEKGRSYRVSFTYRIRKNASEKDGFFYVLARSGSLGVTGDVAFTKLTAAVGATTSASVDFTVGDASDYYFTFGMFRRGEIVVDDVRFELLPDKTSFNGAIDFETGSAALSHCLLSTNTGSGKITSDARYVLGGRYSVFAENAGTAEWYDFLYTDPKEVTLAANTTYEVTFRYRVVKAPPAGSIGFQFFARTSLGDVANDVGTLRFGGAVGTVGTARVVFKTKNYADYYLAFGMQKTGAVVIDDITLKKSTPLTITGTHGFENGSIPASGFSADTLAGTGCSSITADASRVISGTYSVFADNAAGVEWYDFLYSASEPFKPSTTYLVTFKYRVVRPTPDGSAGFMVFARSSSVGVPSDVGTTHFKGEAGAAGTVSTVFTTKSHADYYLAFSMNRSGAVVLDDIVVTVIPTPSLTGTQGFETGSFAAAGYTSDSVAGPDRSSITSDDARVITGRYSVFADNAAEEWYEFLSTRNDVLPLAKSSSYTVKFNYRVVRAVDAGSAGFLFFSRSSLAGISRDVGTTYFAKDAPSGTTGSLEVTFSTINFADYRLVWSMNKGGAIVIDDVQVTKNP